MKMDEAQKQRLAELIKQRQIESHRRQRNAFLVIAFTLAVNVVLTVITLAVVVLK